MTKYKQRSLEQMNTVTKSLKKMHQQISRNVEYEEKKVPHLMLKFLRMSSGHVPLGQI